MSPCSVSSRRIVMVAFPGANAVDVIGPLEVFSVAAALRPHEAGEAPAYTSQGVPTTAGGGGTPGRVRAGATARPGAAARAGRAALPPPRRRGPPPLPTP